MNRQIMYFELCTSLVFIFLCCISYGYETIDTTLGFVPQPLDHSNFDIQKPYNVPVEKRYSFSKGVHKLWVMNTDKPHTPASNTKPRTEIRIRGYDYSSGVWQFEAYGYVPSGTSGVSVMQILGAHGAITQLRVYNGNLYYGTGPVITPDLYNKWFRLNVIDDVEGNNIKVYINGVLKYQGNGSGAKSHFFKCGVYAQRSASFYMESRWKDIKVLKKA